jgi:cytochrome c551/c552
LTGYTFTWTLVNNTSGATLNAPTNNPASISVNSGSAYSGSGSCGKSYTLRFTVFKNGVEVSHCDVTTAVVDTQAPTLTGTLPTGATNQNLCFNAIPTGPTEAQIAALYTDNCGTVHVVKSGTPTGTSCSWTVTYHYVITDDCNNAATPVDITYSGGDKTAPTLKAGASLPSGATNQNLCLSAVPSGPSEADIQALYADNCGGTVHVVKSGTPTGTNCSWSVTYHYVITDDCNNAATPVDITYSGGDKTAPTRTGTLPTGATNQNLCFSAIPVGPLEADIAALYTDNCGGTVHVVKTGTPTGDNCSWTVTYHYVITDDCNNATDAVDITYSGGDKTAPTLKVAGSLPAGATNQNLCFSDIPTGPTEAQIAALYSDNCGGTVHVVKTGTPTGTSCSWTVTYHYVITDDCNNAATPVDITYSGGDKTAPTRTGTLPTGATNQNLCFSAIPTGPTEATIAALYTDNCGGTVHVVKSGTPTGTSCSWSVTYHYVITDDCNNAATPVDITYSGGDTESPIITSCPGDQVIECSVNKDDITKTGGGITATDNCGTPSTSYQDVVTNVGCSKVITRTWTATDACAHTATCVQKIIVRDRTLPVFDCVTTGTPTVTDNCTSQANLIVYFKDNGNVRTWTAIDESGNIGTCQQTLPNTLRISGSTNTQVVNTTLVDPKDKKSLSKAQAANASQVQVQAYPNPFKDQVQFVVTSPVSGKGSLDVYNALGQKIKTVFQGNIIKGTQNFSLHLTQRQVSNLIYVLRVGGQQVSGKILQVNQ